MAYASLLSCPGYATARACMSRSCRRLAGLEGFHVERGMNRQSRRLAEYWAESRTCTSPCALFHVKHAPLGECSHSELREWIGRTPPGSTLPCEVRDRAYGSVVDEASRTRPADGPAAWSLLASRPALQTLQGLIGRTPARRIWAAVRFTTQTTNGVRCRAKLFHVKRGAHLWISQRAPRPIQFSDLVHIGKPVWSRKTTPSLGAGARAARPSDYTVQAVRPFTGMSKPSLPVECRRRCSPLTKRSARVGTQIARAVRGFPN